MKEKQEEEARQKQQAKPAPIIKKLSPNPAMEMMLQKSRSEPVDRPAPAKIVRNPELEAMFAKQKPQSSDSDGFQMQALPRREQRQTLQVKDLASFKKPTDLEGNAIEEEENENDFFDLQVKARAAKPLVKRKNRGTVYKAAQYDWDD